MATRILRVSTLTSGTNLVAGTLGNHCLVYCPESHKVYGFQGDYPICSVDVEKDDILIYNCGEIKVMEPWRKRAYNLIGYMPITITKRIPKTHDEGVYCTTSKRSASGDFYRRVNKHICLRATGRSNELFSYDTGYVSGIYATSIEELLKFLGKRENVALVKAHSFSLRSYWVDSKGNRI